MIQLNLTGFLEKETPGFCKAMWTLLLSAQASPQGVPTELLEQKKEELRILRVRKRRERWGWVMVLMGTAGGRGKSC